MDEEYDKWLTFKVIMGAIAVLYLVVLTWLFYNSILAFFVFKTKSWILLLFLFMLLASTVLNMCFAVNEIIQRPSSDWLRIKSTCVFNIFSWTRLALYTLTILVAWFNWIFQSINIIEQKTELRFKTFVLWVLLISLIIFYSCGCCIYAIYYWASHDQNSKYEATKDFFIILGVSWIIISALFGIFAFIFNFVVLKLAPEMAKKFKWRILMNLLIIWFWVIARGVNILTTSKSGNYEDNMMKSDFTHNGWHYGAYVFVYFLILTIVPTILHILTLRLVLDYKKRLDRNSHWHINSSRHKDYNCF